MGKPYSHTRFNLFESCPRSYKFKYVDKVPETPSRPLLIGRVIHDILAEYTEHLAKNGLQTDVTALPAIGNKVFFDKPAGLEVSDLGEVLRILRAYAQTSIFDPTTVAGIEEMMRVDLMDGKVTFWAVIDRYHILGRRARIVDLKTDWVLRSQTDVANDHQLQIYCWAVAQRFRTIDEFEVTLDFVRHGVQRTAEFDRSIIPAIEERILAQIGQIEREKKFAPRPGAACSWCSYCAQCPAAQEANQAGEVLISTPEDARVWAGRAAVLEAQLDRIKGVLKNFANVNGPIDANGLQWGFHKSESVGVKSTQEFIDALSSAGIDATPWLTVGATDLKKLMAKNAKAAQALEPVLVDKSYTRFDAKKLKGDDAA